MLATNEQHTQTGFMLPDLQNNLVELPNNDHKTVVYFFAPWCSICRISINNLQDLYERSDNINIIAIALDYQHRSEVDKFAEKLQLSFPIVLGNESIKQNYKVTAYPSYYVLNEKQIIEHRSMGYSSALGLYLRSL
ncbi:TlpA family protein disulfide reductase [Colwelliaceae bacterium BS250]